MTSLCLFSVFPEITGELMTHTLAHSIPMHKRISEFNIEQCSSPKEEFKSSAKWILFSEENYVIKLVQWLKEYF